MVRSEGGYERLNHEIQALVDVIEKHDQEWVVVPTFGSSITNTSSTYAGDWDGYLCKSDTNGLIQRRGGTVNGARYK